MKITRRITTVTECAVVMKVRPMLVSIENINEKEVNKVFMKYYLENMNNGTNIIICFMP